MTGVRLIIQIRLWETGPHLSWPQLSFALLWRQWVRFLLKSPRENSGPCCWINYSVKWHGFQHSICLLLCQTGPEGFGLANLRATDPQLPKLELPATSMPTLSSRIFLLEGLGSTHIWAGWKPVANQVISKVCFPRSADYCCCYS